MKKLITYHRDKFIVPILLFSLFSFRSYAQETPVYGLYDLRQSDLENKNVSLEGDCVFYWKQFVVNEPGRDSIVTSFPALWTNMRDSNDYRIYGSKGYGTYRITLLLPENRNSLALDMPDVYGGYELYANGHIVATTGILDSSGIKSAPGFKNKLVPLPAFTGDTLTLDLQVSNYNLSKGGIIKAIRIGTYQHLKIYNQKDAALDWIISGSLFMGGLLFLGLFVFGTRDNTILFFSLFCLAYSVRIGATNNYHLLDIFPGMSWLTLLRIEYITLGIPAIFFAFYIYHLKNKKVYKAAVWPFAGLSALFTVLSLVTPSHFFTAILPYYMSTLGIFILYILYLFALAVKENKPGAVFGLAANVVLISIFLIHILNYYGIIPPLRFFQVVGYIGFFFLQSLILSRKFSFKLVEAKKEAEAGLVEKSHFLSVMSHEIRTPLNAVIGISEMMRTYKLSEQEMKDNIELLSFSAGNLLAIINDILDFNKIEAEKIEFEQTEIDIDYIINKVVKSNESIAGKKNIKLNLFVSDTVPKTVIGDPLRLTQVLNNLLNNAIKFTDYGYVTITANRVVRSNKKVSIEFKVIDTGIGIENDKLGIIFNAFTQADSSTARSYGGTGLGLSISSRLLSLQGSELKVESKPGKGSVFFFTLDFTKHIESIPEHQMHVEAFPVMAQKVEAPVKKDIAQSSILLTEDNELNIKFTKRYLEKWGVKVSVARNGKEAVDMFGHEHDLILMDLQMPGMDGFEATTIIRGRNKKIPIIAFTANTEEKVWDRIMKAGMNDMIAKPFAPDMLKNLILKYL